MSETVLKAAMISKKYKRLMPYALDWKTVYALDKVNIEIHQGDIYGFVGANGSGKTTFIRILAGLVQQTSGEIELFGEKNQKNLYQQRRFINGIIENPALDPALTAQDNLEVCRLQQGNCDKSRIGEVLELAGLLEADIKGLKVKHFSLGMKQRLGIAKALLSNPKFLFLDEPLNGLDPAGIKDFRTLIRMLHENGITILISSHILNELDSLATCYGFLHKGKMIEQISAEALAQKRNRYMLLRVDKVPQAEEVLHEVFNISNYQVISNDTIHLYEQLDQKGQLMKAFVINDINVEEMTEQGEGLEAYYMSLIRKK